MPNSSEIDDFYRVPAGGGGGVLLRRWEWVEIRPAEVDAETGEEITPAMFGPGCRQAPLSLLVASDEEIAAQIIANAEVRARVAAGEAPAAAPVAAIPPASYRALRKMAYLLEIGGGTDPVDGFGNQADALFKDRHNDPTELVAMDAVIAAIKDRYREDAPWRTMVPA